MKQWRIVHIDEPELEFAHGQTAAHPKDGLFLYGPPPSNLNPRRMEIGIIATEEGAKLYGAWVKSINGSIAPPGTGKEANKYIWPGFQAAFGAEWSELPFGYCRVGADEISKAIRTGTRHEGIYHTVEIYQRALRKHLLEEEASPKIWFAIIPEEVYTYGRPQSVVPKAERVDSPMGIKKTAAIRLLKQPTMFNEINDEAKPFEYEPNFHNQLKARLLDTGKVIQVVRETTLTTERDPTLRRRSLQDPASVAWNLGATAFYKSSGTPWRLANVREGVCYVGLVFKKLAAARGRDNACCGAQMFLHSGEGVVFKGAVGPWYSENDHNFKLDRAQAARLMTMIVEGYKDIHGSYPKELFIHGKIEFGDEEWAGFTSTVPAETNLVGVQIRRQNEIKLFRFGQNPVLRGTGIIVDEKLAYLWTAGYVPRLETYPGREVPNPLTVRLRRGSAEIETVLQDVMALTKLNYNSAGFSDGLPVTLRFADLVGEILTAGPEGMSSRLPFRHYI
ncbi:hypothetical protein GCM10007301_38160 [Azorhizobium oxalatiphilum]|uniref:Piwi domain-containing protein n=1 Tax=Azorhizobium oxalatiphilum TaxID=980631 RepID=A0A917C7S5_9HYPH|nr:hypothetical protein [Azorhizobium oxalatiphilum]GGF74660.1 hypothetical protein GCM10007301_38160 [Azorhizobium oxalatiphilum]